MSYLNTSNQNIFYINLYYILTIILSEAFLSLNDNFTMFVITLVNAKLDNYANQRSYHNCIIL